MRTTVEFARARIWHQRLKHSQCLHCGLGTTTLSRIQLRTLSLTLMYSLNAAAPLGGVQALAWFQVFY
eukprot:6209782-Pleurochrysis_carterae.AAC.2